ncbi:beta-glucoside operon antiterminator [Corynebacterium vitaeruminis DSM 20294]|uniref:Beta-glucoside operon antiterminator n=1 Tax=Corynebacterium vitaeruminis DSM 20294 TaxID=1224164 RepID=W5Y7H9_9CORY|nr:beta-glucoside operon antiterminator [Corynebacterium vitaeruminis DSM 20294]
MGKGLSFGRKLGDTIDAEQAEQVFRPSTVHPIANRTALLSEIPLELITLASEIVSESQIRKDPELLTPGLADHISFALERAKGGLEVSYPLVWEVSPLYPKEYTLGKLALDRIEQLSGVRLHGDEAAAIAMHFINAQFAAGDMSKAEASTKEIANTLALVSAELGRELSPDSTTVARFITHLRYLFVRLDADRPRERRPHGGQGGADRAVPPRGARPRDQRQRARVHRLAHRPAAQLARLSRRKPPWSYQGGFRDINA